MADAWRRGRVRNQKMYTERDFMFLCLVRRAGFWIGNRVLRGGIMVWMKLGHGGYRGFRWRRYPEKWADSMKHGVAQDL